MRKKIVAVASRFAIALTCAGSLLLTACGGENSTTGEKNSNEAKRVTTIAYADPTAANPQFKAVGDEFVSAAQKQGIDVFRFDNDLSPETALTNARLMVQRNPDMIVNWSAASSANAAVGKIYQDAKIPCIALNVAIPGCSLFNQQSRDLGIGEAEVAAGIMAERNWKIEDTSLLMVWAPTAGPEVNELSTYFYSTFAQGYPMLPQINPAEITLTTTNIGNNVSYIDGGGQLQQSNTVVTQALHSIPQDRHVIVVTLNDESGLGAKQALAAAGRESNSALISNVASEQGLDQLRENDNWVAEGSVFFDLWGKYALAMTLAKADGVELPELTGSPISVLTKSSVDEFYQGTAIVKAPDFLPSNQYLAPYLDQIGGPLPS